MARDLNGNVGGGTEPVQAEPLARQMARFDARPDLDLCVTHLQAFWIAELTEEAARFRDHPLSGPLPGYSTVTLLARRALFERVGRFNVALSVGDPMEWFLRAAHEGAVMELLPETLVYRRMHQRNLSWDVDETRRMTTAMQASVLRVVKESLDRRRREDRRCAPTTSGASMSRALVSCVVPCLTGALPAGSARQHPGPDLSAAGGRRGGRRLDRRLGGGGGRLR
jgi:hypothetical protein